MPGLLVAPLVRDVAVAHEVGVLVDPVERGAGLVLEVADQLLVAGPALVLVEEDDVQRGRVDRAVIGRVRALLEGRHLAVSHLVQDPPRILVAEVVTTAALPVAEHPQRRGRQLGRERQRLEAGEDAVAAEHRHEPRQPGGRQALAAGHRRREAEGRQVDQAAPVGRGQRPDIAFQAGSALDPTFEAALEVRARLLPAALVFRRRVRTAGAGPCRDDVEIGRPAAVRLDPDGECQAALRRRWPVPTPR